MTSFGISHAGRWACALGANAKVADWLDWCMKDSRDGVRALAAGSLGWLGVMAKVALPALIEALKDDCPEVRVRAAQARGEMNEEALPAVPALIESLKDPGTAGFALNDREPLMCLEAKYNGCGLRHFGPNDQVSSSAATALGKIGVKAKAAVPRLIQAMDSNDIHLRLAAANALGMLGEAAAAAVPTLLAALKEDFLREAAANALGKWARWPCPQ